MPLSQIEVGPPSATSLGDNQVTGVLGGKQGDMIVSQLHGKYYTQAVRGNVYYASTAAAGLANTIFSATSAPTFVGLLVWNPQGSGKNLSMIKANVGISAVAATAQSAWGYAWVNNAGSGVATAGVVSSFTGITATRGPAICSLGGQGASVALAGSAATFTTALAWGRSASFSSSTGAITTQTVPAMMSEDFDGMMIVPPGTIFALTSAILSGITAVSTLFWEETPV